MDGLFTKEDIDNRFYVMRQCLTCKQWTQYDTRSDKRWVCTCGSEKYDASGARSIRSWLVTKDVKVSRNSRKKSQA